MEILEGEQTMLSLIKILELPRKHGSVGERHLGNTLQKRHNGTWLKDYAVYVDNGDGPLFVAHMDTVERRVGIKKKNLKFDKGFIMTDGKDTLGADDGVGVWILSQLLDAGVKGGYLFTTGEEVGCVGASGIVKDFRFVLEKYDMSIEFDRRGTQDIITEMTVGNTASTTFATKLASLIGMGHKPATGIYTDVAQFQDIISENVNVACGYYNEHGTQEKLNIGYVRALLKNLIALDWSQLKVYRDPKTANLYFGNYDGYGFNGKTSNRMSGMEKYVYNNHDVVAEYLKLIGVTIDEIQATLKLAESKKYKKSVNYFKHA